MNSLLQKQSLKSIVLASVALTTTVVGVKYANGVYQKYRQGSNNNVYGLTTHNLYWSRLKRIGSHPMFLTSCLFGAAVISIASVTTQPHEYIVNSTSNNNRFSIDYLTTHLSNVASKIGDIAELIQDKILSEPKPLPKLFGLNFETSMIIGNIMC